MKTLSLIALFILSITISSAQETYTDEELTTYATVMVWAEAEKAAMTDIYNDWINNNEEISAQVFLDIKNTKGDSVKIEELEVSDVELAAFETIQLKEDSLKASFKDVYIGKIKEDIGVGLYNRLKDSLKSDEGVKSRYDAIYQELKLEIESEEQDSEE